MTTDLAFPVVEEKPLGPGAGGLYRRQNFFTGLGVGVLFGFIGWLISDTWLQSNSSTWLSTQGYSDGIVAVTMVMWVIGFNIGVGSFNAPLRWMLGRDQTPEDELYAAGVGQGNKRYWKFCTDHKVVGIQYLVLVMVLFGTGGTLAMMMRTQLFNDHSSFLSPETYNSIVSIHGMCMIIATIIMVTGPFTNFVMPIMIGARDMAFPRLNALSFWLVVSAVPCLLATFFLGGVNSGWTSYAPLSVQGPAAMDAFAICLITFAVSVTVSGVNIVVTAFTMRAQGLTVGRLPIFVWGSLSSVGLGLYAMPAFMLTFAFVITDRVVGTSFYEAAGGGSGWLYENAFWIFGHPEVYVILLAPVGAMLEVASTFARKPLFGYNVIVGALAAIMALSIMVWAHHMFTTGWAPDLSGPFMVTTELISVPTGIIFLCVVGTLWRGSIWTRLPMYFVYLFMFNFIIGGVTGIYLSDVPADEAFHGDMFVTAHFHYTLLGGAMIAATAGLCYWFPKITGKMLNERIGKAAFWMVALGIQFTYVPMFWEGLEGMPRRLASYAPMFLTANRIATGGAYLLMLGWIVFLYGMLHSLRHGEDAPPNPWRAKTLEWMVPTPVPLANFPVDPVVTSDFYGYGELAPQPALDPEREPELVPAGSARPAGVGGQPE